MAMTWGCSRRENRVAMRLRNGSEPRASRVSSGSIVTRITVTDSTVMKLLMVSGTMTTKAWICWRSVLARLVSWPVCASSWKAKCRRCTWAKIRARRLASTARASRRATKRRSPVKTAEARATQPSTTAQLRRAVMSSRSIPSSTACRTITPVLTLAAVQARPVTTPMAMPNRRRPASRTINLQPLRRAVLSELSDMRSPHLAAGARHRELDPRVKCIRDRARPDSAFRAGARSAVEQRRGQLPPLLERQGADVGVEHLDAHVVGARLPVLGHPGRDRVDVAPGDQRVDERVAAAVGQVVVPPPEPAQVAHVVGQRQVDLHVLAGGVACHLGVGGQHRRLLDHEHRPVAEVPAGDRRVLD